MEFNRINNSNKIIRSGENVNKKDSLPANEIKSEDKIKDFSSDYSSAIRALGLSSITFKGIQKENKPDFQTQKEDFRKKRLETTGHLSKSHIDNIMNLITEKNFEIVKTLYAYSSFSSKDLRDILNNVTDETFEYKTKFLKHIKDKRDISKYISALCDTDVESIKTKDYFCEVIENSNLDPDEKHKRCTYIISQNPIKTKEAKASFDFFVNTGEFTKEKATEIFSTPHISDLASQKEINNFIQKLPQQFNEDEKINILKWTNKENIDIAKMLLFKKECDTETVVNIIKTTNQESKALIWQLLEENIIPFEKIGNIGNSAEEDVELKTKFYNRFKKHEALDKKVLGDILKNIYKENYKFAIKIIQDNHLPQEEMAEAIQAFNCTDTKYTKKIYNLVKKIDKKEIKNFGKLLAVTYEDNFEAIKEYLENYKAKGLQFSDIALLIDYKTRISEKELIDLRRKVGEKNYEKIAQNPSANFIAAKFKNLYQVQNINELSIAQKRKVTRSLISANNGLFAADKSIKEFFPLIPTSKEEYCKLLPALVKSMGIETNQLSDEEIKILNSSLSSCAEILSKLSDEDFNNLTITQDFTREKFIETINEKISHLSKEEKQKVFDYYGFEIHEHTKTQTGYTITGYPINLNNGEKLNQIKDPETKKVVENIRKDVINFSENNKIICNNKEIEKELNTIAKYLPEIHSLVDKKQHKTHSFDILKHSLKVIQKSVQNPSFKNLNENDKNLMLLTCLMHDTAKYEGVIDKHHETESAFDAYFITKKFNLSKDNEIKLYTLIKNHDWFKQANTIDISSKKTEAQQKEEKLKKVAFAFQYDNLFEMAKILTEADLKGIKSNNSFYDTFNKNENFIATSKRIEELVKDLQKTRPMLPTTKLPKASEIKSKITTVNPDYSTNIKGVYQDENGMIIIRYNEVENWEKLGFKKGEISEGISFNNEEKQTTGTIKFIAHGLERPEQVANFDAFSLPESDAMLSVSYMERPESKYRLFRTQGVLLDVDTKYIYGGGETDAGSGYAKSIDNFINGYAFEDGSRHSDRIFVSNLIKKTLNLNDEEYIKFLKENEDKSFSEIEPKETREKLVKEFAKINSTIRRGERSYNEMYVSNPKVQGVFAYSETDTLGETKEFLAKERINFLKKYALENDVPFVLFGN